MWDIVAPAKKKPRR